MTCDITFYKNLESTESFDSVVEMEILFGKIYKGDPGESAYDAAKKGGFVGTLGDFYKALGETGVQADWNEVDPDSSSFIMNKPDLSKKQDKQDNSLQTKDKTITGAINELVAAVFPLSIAVTGGGVFKKGTTQVITVSWSIKAGSATVVPDSLKVNGVVETNTNTSKQFTGVASTTTYTVEATRNGVVKSASTTATFVNPSYIGVVASNFSVSESSIKALTEVVKNSNGYTASGLNLVNQKICYAYPKTFGSLSSIKDANGFDNLSAYTRSEVTVNGEACYVYVMTDPASQSNVKQIYA